MRWIIHPEVRSEISALEFSNKFIGAFDTSSLDAATELFRDRARDERGFFRQLRLWLDLLKDLVISLPRTYSGARVLTSVRAQPLQQIRAFQLLEAGGPRGMSILYATMLSLAVFASLLVWLGHGPKLLGEPWTLTDH
jgi:alkylation response protein AidB-like acyl-CoA dehydrogenase